VLLLTTFNMQLRKLSGPQGQIDRVIVTALQTNKQSVGYVSTKRSY